MDETITVTRSKNYPCRAHPGPAWKWVYDVTIPGEQYTFSGDGLGWVKRLCKSKRPDLKIVYAWEAAS
jgi:hypothetical protein